MLLELSFFLFSPVQNKFCLSFVLLLEIYEILIFGVERVGFSAIKYGWSCLLVHCGQVNQFVTKVHEFFQEETNAFQKLQRLFLTGIAIRLDFPFWDCHHLHLNLNVHDCNNKYLQFLWKQCLQYKMFTWTPYKEFCLATLHAYFTITKLLIWRWIKFQVSGYNSIQNIA